MYMAEAFCMIGKSQESLSQIELAENLTSDFLLKNDPGKVQTLVQSVENKMRVIKVQNAEQFSSTDPAANLTMSEQPDSSLERLSIDIVNKLNRCVVYLCQGNFQQAR
mmetsp:Transcript_1506/g.2660  ORF Transcript_1506/g.2660 Transcript_1506/m.2660 type:complete len:108 (-) Transcript_1506:467-790(-)